jgi:methylmalonyl-CoA/ethylmalonyl-CoA epimerase
MMIQFDTLGHINIVVDDIEEATEFYRELFGAVPIQDFPHFRNNGFAKSAGFLSEPEQVDVTVRFLQLPTKEGVMIELMQYFTPVGRVIVHYKKPNDMNCLGHIAFRIKNIDAAFNHVKNIKGVRFISDSEQYKPYKIDNIKSDEFTFFDKKLEEDPAEKKKVRDIVGNIRFFYIVDKYGIQWELEEGHSDIGSE